MEGTMKTAVMTDIGRVEIQQRPVPQPGKGEVLVKVEYVGICGSDLHYMDEFFKESSTSLSSIPFSDSKIRF